ncbi:MAG: hypothetical protein ABIB79_00925 [archaeon]
MAVECDFMYDSFSDRLLISRKREGDKVVGSIGILNLVIDFTGDNRVANVELKGASKYLKSLDIDPSILDKLTGAKLMLKQCRDGYLISFILSSGDITERIPYNVQSQKVPVLVN